MCARKLLQDQLHEVDELKEKEFKFGVLLFSIHIGTGTGQLSMSHWHEERGLLTSADASKLLGLRFIAQ